MTQAEADFLRDLTELTKKHKIAISGCGCCGSPFLEPIPEINIYGKYIFNRAYSGQIVYVQPDDYYWKANDVVCI